MVRTRVMLVVALAMVLIACNQPTHDVDKARHIEIPEVLRLEDADVLEDMANDSGTYYGYDLSVFKSDTALWRAIQEGGND